MTLDELVAASVPAVETFEHSGRRFYLQPLSGNGREAYLRYMRDKEQFSMAGVALFGLCTPEGAVLGDPFDAGDREKVGRIDGATLEAICNRFLLISGLATGSGDAAEKNSEPSPSESSGIA